MAAAGSHIRLRIRGPDNSTHTISEVTSDSTLSTLLMFIEAKLHLSSDQMELMIGFPPKAVTAAPEDTLATAGITDGESIQVVKRGVRQAPIRGFGQEFLSRAPNTGCFVKRQMPADHSCLFHSVAYVLKDKDMSDSIASELRNFAAIEIGKDPRKYNDQYLGCSNRIYQQRLLGNLEAGDAGMWGGAIELEIFAERFQAEIVAFDIRYLREDIFGAERGFKKRAFIAYQGDHYDAIAHTSSLSASSKDDLVVFPVDDMRAWESARTLVEGLHRDYARAQGIQPQKEWRHDTTPKGPGHSLRDKKAPSSNRAPPANAASAASNSSSNTGQWTCKACTFINTNPTARKCEICSTTR